jgi:hypothetical protein
MRIESSGMSIEAEVGSVSYRLTADPEGEEYEITGVSAEHVEALERAENTPGFSAAATVEVLTYLHRNEHFDSAGRLAPPAPGWKRAEESARSAIDRRGKLRI